MKILLAIVSVWFLSETKAQFLPWYPQPFYQSPLLQPQFFYQSQVPAPQVYQAPSIQPQVQTYSQQTDNYRGFGYHTAYQDGASATVVFFRGGDVSNPSTATEKITIASEGLDPTASKNVEDQIKKALSAQTTVTKTSLPSLPNLAPIVRALFQDPTPLNGVVHFYSAPGFPASTSPLGTLFNRAAFTLPLNVSSPSTNSTEKDEEPEHEPAESVVNALSVDGVKEAKDSSTTESSSTTTSTSTSSSTSTSTSTTVAASSSTEAATTESSTAGTTETEALNDTVVVGSTDEASSTTAATTP